MLNGAGPATVPRQFPERKDFAMTLFTFLAAAAPGANAGPIEQIKFQFGLNGWALLSQIISFSIVAFLLYRFAYNPILSVLEARRKLIADSLKNAELTKTQLAEAQKAAELVLTKASADATKMIEEARAAAKLVGERESQRAVAQAADIIQKAREAGEAEQKRLMAELKKELSRLIVETTAKVTGKVLNATDQRKITEEATRELAA
jgi:F-type H+-transporting ATPase subunit b